LCEVASPRGSRGGRTGRHAGFRSCVLSSQITAQ
jgi:hypothetical protein